MNKPKKTKTIHCGYVQTSDGTYLLQIPDRDSQLGFYLADEDSSWDGGFGIATEWEIVDDQDVPKKVRRILGPILEDARPVLGRPSESADGAARDAVIRVRVSPIEKARIEELAGDTGVSEYVRSQILPESGARTRRPPSSRLEERTRPTQATMV